MLTMLPFLDRPIVLFILATVLLVLAVVLWRRPKLVSGARAAGAALALAGIGAAIAGIVGILHNHKPVRVTDINQLGDSDPRAFTSDGGSLRFVADTTQSGKTTTFIYQVTGLSAPRPLKLSASARPIPSSSKHLTVWEDVAGQVPVFGAGASLYAYRDGNAHAECRPAANDAIVSLAALGVAGQACYAVSFNGKRVRVWRVNPRSARYSLLATTPEDAGSLEEVVFRPEAAWPLAVIVRKNQTRTLWLLHRGSWQRVRVRNPSKLRAGAWGFYVAAYFASELRIVPIRNGVPITVATSPAEFANIDGLCVRQDSGKDRITVLGKTVSSRKRYVWQMQQGDNVVSRWLNSSVPDQIVSKAVMDTGSSILLATSDARCWVIEKQAANNHSERPDGMASGAKIEEFHALGVHALFALEHTNAGTEVYVWYDH